MTLVQKQQLFSGLIADLIVYLQSTGTDVTLGEAWRSPETCALYAADGRGIKHSNHQNRLAIDLLLWENGELLTEPRQYLPAGTAWKNFSSPDFNCVWGGDFDRVDVYHFAIEHNGVK